MEITPPGPGAAAGSPRDALLRSRAQELEAAFLAEMLSHAGLDAESGRFSGGSGETQFTSFLRDEQARQMVRHGGIGLAEQIFQSLRQREGQP